MDHPRKTVAIHGSPPKMVLFMERPLGNGGSWIALGKWWRFMDRPPKNGGGSWITP